MWINFKNNGRTFFFKKDGIIAMESKGKTLFITTVKSTGVFTFETEKDVENIIIQVIHE